MKALRRGVLVFLALPAAWLAAALLLALVPGTVTPRDPGAGRVTIGLVRGPIHYDFLLPLTPAIRGDFAFLQAQGMPLGDPRARYLVAGWGARGFYTTVGTYAGVSVGAVWQAATGDGSVLHFDLAGEIAQGPLWLTVGENQLAALSSGIRQEMASPEPLRVQPFGEYDLFFPARARFNLFHTCNSWVGERLRDAGLPFGAWTPLPVSVTLSARWFGLVAADPA